MAARFVGRHARAEVVVDVELKVGMKFCFEFPFLLRFLEEVEDALKRGEEIHWWTSMAVAKSNSSTAKAGWLLGGNVGPEGPPPGTV